MSETFANQLVTIYCQLLELQLQLVHLLFCPLLMGMLFVFNLGILCYSTAKSSSMCLQSYNQINSNIVKSTPS